MTVCDCNCSFLYAAAALPYRGSICSILGRGTQDEGEHCRRRAQAPKTKSCCSEPHVFATAQDFFRCKYFEILDLAIQCLTRRISNKAVAVLSRIEEVIQEAWSGKAFNEQSVGEICQHYRGQFDQRRLQAQLLCFRTSGLQLLRLKLMSSSTTL